MRAAATARNRTRGDGRPDDQAIVKLVGKRFDQSKDLSEATVCVLSDMVLWRWDHESLKALADALAPGGALVFLEPTAELGWRRWIHRLGRNAWRLGLRHNFEHDVPAKLRAAGLVVTTTDRFGIGPLGIRSYVWGQAEHITVPDSFPAGPADSVDAG